MSRLVIKPIEAKLKRDTSLGNMSPYCVITCGDLAQKTAVDEDGKKNPRWTNELVFMVQRDDRIKIAVWDSGLGSMEDLLVCQTMYSVKGLLSSGESEKWLSLTAGTWKKGAEAGQIRLKFSCGAAEPPQKPVQQAPGYQVVQGQVVQQVILVPAQQAAPPQQYAQQGAYKPAVPQQYMQQAYIPQQYPQPMQGVVPQPGQPPQTVYVLPPGSHPQQVYVQQPGQPPQQVHVPQPGMPQPPMQYPPQGYVPLPGHPQHQISPQQYPPQGNGPQSGHLSQQENVPKAAKPLHQVMPHQFPPKQ